MKRCPECRRDYYDDTLNFCLDDGVQLVDGPGADNVPTVILPQQDSTVGLEKRSRAYDKLTAILPSDAIETAKYDRLHAPKNIWIFLGFAILLSVAGFITYRYFATSGQQVEPVVTVEPKTEIKLYWEMSDEEKSVFIAERARHVQQLIGDEPADLDQRALNAIREQIDDYVEHKDSLSQKPFEEGLRVIYGRASQFAPIVSKSYEARKVPPALGIYQAMVESEYHDCPKVNPHPGAPVGIFQFRRSTAEMYGITPKDYCDVQKQSDAAAHYMSDLISDFGSEKSSWTLALFSFNSGAEQVRDYLRQLRSSGITERSFWAVFRHQSDLRPAMSKEANRYVPRFFAAAIIGETPETFELSTPPLTTLRVK